MALECEESIEKDDEEFDLVTYHLFCRNCGKSLPLKHVRTKNGVKNFFERGRLLRKIVKESRKKIEFKLRDNNDKIK